MMNVSLSEKRDGLDCRVQTIDLFKVPPPDTYGTSRLVRVRTLAQ